MWWLYKFLGARVPETEFMYSGNLDPWRLNEWSSSLKVIAADGSSRIASAGEAGRLRNEILNVTTGQGVGRSRAHNVIYWCWSIAAVNVMAPDLLGPVRSPASMIVNYYASMSVTKPQRPSCPASRDSDLAPPEKASG